MSERVKAKYGEVVIRVTVMSTRNDVDPFYEDALKLRVEGELDHVRNAIAELEDSKPVNCRVSLE